MMPLEAKPLRREGQPPSRQDFISTHIHRSQSHSDINRPHSSPSNHPSPLVHRARANGGRPSHSRSRSGKAVDSLRVAKKQALMRTRRFGPGEEYPESHKAVLEILTPVDSMCTGWDEEELKIGRRLVRFTRNQEGFILKLTCEPIKQEEYTDGDTVISCIYRRDSDICYVTSVDIIFLLESIVGDGFEIEEKNRIRRNLEGFRPKTVSKNRAGSETFFQQIMDFPTPKPRNIEKDVKVFEWSILPQAQVCNSRCIILPITQNQGTRHHLPPQRSCDSRHRLCLTPATQRQHIPVAPRTAYLYHTHRPKHLAALSARCSTIHLSRHCRPHLQDIVWRETSRLSTQYTVSCLLKPHLCRTSRYLRQACIL
ncbi:hypothetical protein BC835DRAFT_1325692 [Cytidiella melzeri]|nr:hypothetical protein BC835DRAFT_1325692 [Cytidiella melzeri]